MRVLTGGSLRDQCFISFCDPSAARTCLDLLKKNAKKKPAPYHRDWPRAVKTDSKLVEQAQLGNLRERQLRRLQHGLLQGQASQHFRWIGVLNSVLR